ncbi:hemerythrin domain-containing protein [Streptomyces sp. ME19-01-6]|uniref:hemerythrin domain-containing protein n=1 Tax=Streptomyces sp. ME19-01-6 TaxID=3028686 RepID=UPI0029B611C5|nr:hemerythrin domain-containing protein [Streptomyces sp. ME19-01-6]MDX3231721.1 hemerythrin domain-containing protein [Streptomyces sp. ME19-01-6]
MVTSVKEQTVEELGGSTSVLARQRRDHAEIDRLMDRYDTTTGLEREAALKGLVRRVFGHAFAEETVLWPVVRRAVPEGERLTSQVEEEHQQINDLVTDIERLDAGDPSRAEELGQAFALIRQDIRDEEDQLLPRLREAMSPTRLRRIGAGRETARRVAPTHPHPVVPRRPPGNVVLGVPLSAFDRARDLLGTASPGALFKRPAAWGTGLALLTWSVIRWLRRAREPGPRC